MSPVPRTAPEHLGLFIDGTWRDALSGSTFPTEDPATGEEIAQVAEARAEDVDLAVTAARRAFETGKWRTMSASRRSRLLYRVGDLILENLDEFARLESMDGGKPISETKAVDIPLSAETFHYFAGWPTKITGDTIPVNPRMLTYTLREPLGVCALIVPWNFPLLLAARKLAPALAAGNTVVLKPASQTPLSVLLLAQICQDAGIPPGVVNIIGGSGSHAGEALVAHPGVDKISITGSTRTGQSIMKAAAQNVTKVSLELGGKSPNIILDDADLKGAVRGIIGGIFYNKGEVCTAGSRLFVQSSIHDELIEALVGKAEKMSAGQGDTLDPDTRLGPQVSAGQLDNALRYVEHGREEGAELVTGGMRNDPLGPGVGHFLKPTIFTGVTNQMRIAREEIFGPVLSVIRFDDLDDAITQGNDSFYGLAAGVWTQDLSRAHRAASLLQAGTVWVNCYNVFDAAAPYGGFKRSGFGRENGGAVLDEYTHLKTVILNVG